MRGFRNISERGDGHGRVIALGSPGPGRPKNSRPKLVTALREALDEDATLEKLRTVAMQKLEEGDPAFWRLLLDRVRPIKHEFAAEAQTHITFGWESDGQDEREVVDVSPG